MRSLLRPGHPFWRQLLHLLLVFSFLAVPGLAVLLPHWTIVWFYGGVIGLPLIAWLALGQRPGLDRGLLWPAMLLFLWAAVTTLWTPANPQLALWLALRTFVTVAGALLLLDLARRLPEAVVSATLPWVLPGLLIAIGLLIEEQASHLALTKLMAGDVFQGPRWADRLNRGALAVLLHSFAPALLLWLGGRRLAAWALLLAALVVVSFYRSETALVAGCLALPILGLALWRPDSGRRCFVALGVLLILAPLPIALLLPALGLQEADWLDITARARVQIWSFAAERILERPLFGWGLDASDSLPSFGVRPLLPYAEKVIPIHPHNGLLQIWLEIGLPGVLLAGLLFWRLTRRLAGLRPAAAAFVMAAAAALLMAQSLSFAIWQSRWLALAFIILLQLQLLARTRPAA